MFYSRVTSLQEGNLSKPKKPLFSLEAHGTIADELTYQKGSGTDIVRRKPVPTDPKSLAQLSWRHMYQKALALWRALSPAEQRDWNSQASPRGMTGFAWFMSQALKPNPGLYLPLQGGTMSGDIDMSKHRILKLPLPTDTQEPATKAYHDNVANLPVHGAGKHTDVTRQLSVYPGNYYTGTAGIMGRYPVIKLDPALTEDLYFKFDVPDTFVSFDDLLLSWLTDDALGTDGLDWRLWTNAQWAAHGEPHNTHAEFFGLTIDVPDQEIIYDSTLGYAFANLAKGDHVGMSISRVGGHGDDTYERDIDIIKLILSYVAEQ